jgi:AcrR family transcriptional regulator
LKEQIISSATQLFIEHGYFGLSMRQIAETVGVTKAALYYHFNDKEDLFLSILETYLLRIEKLVTDIRQTEITNKQKIDLIVRRILGQPVDQRAIIRLASQEMAHLSDQSRRSFGGRYHDRFVRHIELILNDGITAGEFRSLDPKVATWSLLGMMYPYFYPVHTEDIALSDETIHQLVNIFLEGVTVT